MKALIIFFMSLLSIALQAQDTLTARIQFACNSATTYSVGSQELADMANGTVISIDAYASVEGNAEANQLLSQQRLEAVCTLLETGALFGTAHGATSQFGKSRGANRVVIVTYVTATKVKTSTTNAEGIVVETPTPSDIEGFNCGNRVDPSVYFADTLQVEEPVTIPTTIVVDAIILTPNAGQAALSVTPVPVDTLFLPTRQAVRFQMREHGMSRKEAIKSIAARKSQWKELEPKTKAKAPKKAKAKKSSMKATRGACRRGLIRFIPNIGC